MLEKRVWINMGYSTSFFYTDAAHQCEKKLAPEDSTSRCSPRHRVALNSCLLMQLLIACCKEHWLVSQLPSEEYNFVRDLLQKLHHLISSDLPSFKSQKHSISGTICLAQDKPWLNIAKELATNLYCNHISPYYTRHQNRVECFDSLHLD